MEVEGGDRISGGELRRQKCEVVRRGDFADKVAAGRGEIKRILREREERRRW